MNERKTVGGTGGKTRSQDVLGSLLMLVGGYLALSVLLGLIGGEPKAGVLTDPVVGLVRFLGEWAGLLMSLGWAILGMVLFLKPKALQPIQPFFAITGLAMGTSLLLGALAARGGAVGAELPRAFAGSTGIVLGIVLGSLCVWTGVGLLVVGRARQRSSKQQSVEPVLGRGREADTDGVSPDEAAALVGAIRIQESGSATPRADPVPSARDSRVRPLGAGALEPTDAATGVTYRQIARESEAVTSSARALARPPAEPPRADLAPLPGAPDLSESPANLLARIALENRERSRTLKQDPSVRFLGPPDAVSRAASNAETVELPFAPSWENPGGEAEFDAVPTQEVDANDEAEPELEAESQSDLEDSETAQSGEPERTVLPFQSMQPWAEELEAEDLGTDELPAGVADAEAEPHGGDEDEAEEESTSSHAELLPAKSRVDQKSLFDEHALAPAGRRAAGPAEPKAAKRIALEDRAATKTSVPERIPGASVASRRADASDRTTSPDGASDPASPERAIVLSAGANDPESAFRKLVFDAGCLVLEENRVAVSMLQRRFELDFDQACAVLDRLQAEGLIGAYMGGRTRDILLSREEWLSKLGSHSPAG